MPLRLRLAFLFAIGAAVVIAVAGLGFMLQLRASLDASVDTGLRTRATALATELSSDRDELPQLGQADEITQILTAGGDLLASSATAGTQSLLDPAQRQQALTGQVSFTTTVLGDRSRLLATTASVGDGQRLLVVGTGTDISDAAVDRVQSALLLGGLPAVLLAGAGAWLLAGAALRPVERMRRQAAEISDRDAGRRLAVPATRDEVAALATTMNGLLARLQGALQRQRGFVADAGHELRTPLAILHTELELAARPGRSQEALIEAIRHAGEETDRLIRLSEDLLLLARADNNQPFLRPVPLSLPDLLRAAARGASTRAADRGITFDVRSHRELTLQADPDRLRQAVDNLLDNATRHAPPGSVITIDAATRTPDHDTATVIIEVADDGPGFPPEFLPHAFERFRRADAARTRSDGGAGLGLSIVRVIAEAHGGQATAANRPGGGAAVTIDLPERSQPPNGQASQGTTQP